MISTINTRRITEAQLEDIKAVVLKASRTGRVVKLKFNHKNLKGLDFSDFTWGQATFEWCDCSGVNFTKARLRKAVFTATTLEKANFNKADLANTYFDHCDCNYANFNETVCHVSKFYRTSLNNTTFQNSKLTYSEIIESDVMDANFHASLISRATLKKSVFSRTSFKKADLYNSYLYNCSFRLVDFTEANCSHVNFCATKLEKAIMVDTNLDYSTLELSCNSLGIVCNDRLINQLAYHLASLMKGSGKEVPKAIRDLANESHLLEKHNLKEIK